MVGNIGMLDKKVQEIISLNIGSLAGAQGSLVSASESREIHSVLVTSCNRKEGRTLTAVSLAQALASQSNAEVLLIDGSFHAPMIHDLFNVSIEPGFSDILTSRATLEEALRKTQDERLMVLPLGASSASLAELHRTGKLEGHLASLRENFDFVIYDGPSIFGASDPSTIARHFDGIVLVVECERTRWEVVQDAKDRLSKAGGKILGVVLNKRKFYIPKAFYGRG